MSKVIVIAHNLRSAHNVGSLLRTADGLGVAKVYLTGYTPYPIQHPDARLPHLANKIHRQIVKTALGAEDSVDWQHNENVLTVIEHLKHANYQICALEQSAKSVSLVDFKSQAKIAVIIGREVEGIEAELLELSDIIVEIPMKGSKESFNVIQAAAMALYQFTFIK